MARAGISKDTRVNLAAKDADMDKVLDALVEAVGGGRIGYAVVKKTIVITTRDALEALAATQPATQPADK